MEVVEEANRAAVESCKKLVAFLSLSAGDGFRPMPVAAETDEVVARFSKVVAVLSDRLGHARARIGKRSPALPVGVDASCLLDRPSSLAPGHTPNGGHVVSSTPAPPPSAATTAATMRSVAPMRSQETEVAPAVLLSPCASVAPAARREQGSAGGVGAELAASTRRHVRSSGWRELEAHIHIGEFMHLAPPILLHQRCSLGILTLFGTVVSSSHLHLDFSDLFSAGEREWNHRLKNLVVVGAGSRHTHP